MSKLLLKFRNLKGEVKNKKEMIKISSIYIINKIKLTPFSLLKKTPQRSLYFFYILSFFNTLNRRNITSSTNR